MRIAPMTALELYGQIKEAADFLGPGFRGLGQIDVTLQDGKLVLKYFANEARIPIPLDE